MARSRNPGSGGARTPAKPAAVSGPGALARRTDGGAGSATQPVRVAPGGAYGSRQAAVEQQQGAPMYAAAPPGGGPPVPSVFRPTDRPNEPITAGLPIGPGPGPETGMLDPGDPDVILQALYKILPHPEIARLMMSGHEPRVGPSA